MQARWTLVLGVGLGMAGCTDDALRIEDHGVAPSAEAGRTAGYSAQRNVYFGDLHVHSRHSFDAYSFGTTVSPDESYRHAKGETIANPFGHEMRLREPLDFLGVTDHGIFLGVVAEWVDPESRAGRLPGAEAFHDINRPENLDYWSMQTRKLETCERWWP